MVILHVLIIKKTLNSSQIITLNSYFGSFTPFRVFTRSYIRIHFPWALTDCTRGNGNVLIFWNHVSDRNNNFWQQLYRNYNTRWYERKWKCSHFLGINFLIEIMISVSNYVVITILNFFKFSITAMWLIVRTDLITIYDIIIFNIEVFYWIIQVLVPEV